MKETITIELTKEEFYSLASAIESAKDQHFVLAHQLREGGKEKSANRWEEIASSEAALCSKMEEIRNNIR